MIGYLFMALMILGGWWDIFLGYEFSQQKNYLLRLVPLNPSTKAQKNTNKIKCKSDVKKIVSIMQKLLNYKLFKSFIHFQVNMTHISAS